MVGWREERPGIPSVPRCAPSGGKSQAALAILCRAEEIGKKLHALIDASKKAMLLFDDVQSALLAVNIEMPTRLIDGIRISREENDNEQTE